MREKTPLRNLRSNKISLSAAYVINAAIINPNRLITEYEAKPSLTKAATNMADFQAHFLVQTWVNSYVGKAGIFGVSNQKRGYKWGCKLTIESTKPIFHAGFKASFN